MSAIWADLTIRYHDTQLDVGKNSKTICKFEEENVNVEKKCSFFIQISELKKAKPTIGDNTLTLTARESILHVRIWRLLTSASDV